MLVDLYYNSQPAGRINIALQFNQGGMGMGGPMGGGMGGMGGGMGGGGWGSGW